MYNFNSYSGVPVPPLQLRRHCTPQCQQSFPLQIKGNSLFFKTQYERLSLREKSHHHVRKSKFQTLSGDEHKFHQDQEGDAESGGDGEIVCFLTEPLNCTGTVCVQGRVGMKCLKDMLPATLVHFSCKAHMLHFVAVCECDWLVSWKGSRNECLRNKWCETSERSVPLSPSEREENDLKFKSTKSYTWCQSKYSSAIGFTC